MPMTPSVVGSESVNRFRLECRRTRLDIDDSKDGTLPATETVAAESEVSESTAIDDKNSVDGRAPVSTLPISPLPTTLKNAHDFDTSKNGGRKEGRKERRKEGRKEGRNEGRKEGRKESTLTRGDNARTHCTGHRQAGVQPVIHNNNDEP